MFEQRRGERSDDAVGSFDIPFDPCLADRLAQGLADGFTDRFADHRVVAEVAPDGEGHDRGPHR